MKKIFVVVLVLFLACGPQATAHLGYNADVVDSLNEIIHPLTKDPLSLSDEDLQSLAYLSDCDVVGLGEATHGTKEFFQMKHRIFKYLVEHFDYNIFAFECDMGESYYVDRYVTTGEGDLEYIMTHIMHFWTWCTEEVKELLLWMQSYNEERSDEDHIHFVGVDCQAITFQAEIVMNYFNANNVSLTAESAHFLQEVDEINESAYVYFENRSLDEKQRWDDCVDQLLVEMNVAKNDFVQSSSRYLYSFVKRIALNIKQVNNFYFGNVSRDFVMAQNTLWANGLCGEQTKVCAWAHNMHLSNASNYFSNGSMGFHLKEALNDKYQIIHFGFSFGKFTAVSLRSFFNLDCVIWLPPLPDSINYVCHKADNKNFILRERDIKPNSSFHKWISQTRVLLDIGALYFFPPYKYYHAYRFMNHGDVLIYWDRTKASDLLY